ncbi:hypothetical protein L1281_002270 [Neisseria sp. HSC-16F19]|nr:DUF3383 domain-containing protein [Neisseria sp. HSC-16F19]MCP2041659.1 hypothetical protein [Neisseria sp. HSC-16F19]
MFQSIPATQIVSVNPAVLSSGGSPLSMNAVFLSKDDNIPTGQHLAFPDASAVGEFFGLASAEFKAAQVYFKGFDNSQIKPGNLYFFPYNSSAEAAYLRGGSVKRMSLAALKALSGSLSVYIDGVEKTDPAINLEEATSFSDAANRIATAMSVTVRFDEQLQAFEIESGSTGTQSEISFATGTLADALKLTEAKGAVISRGSAPDNAAHVMEGVLKSTLNFATFTTVFEPEIEDKLALAQWSNAQNNRFLYVAWGKEEAAKQTGNTSCFGAQLKEAAYDGTAAVWGGLDKAAFVCGAIASIDFTETQGRITLAFKNQSGLEVDITDATEAKNLEANGYNYYGAWATANDRFLFMYPGQLPGKWKWIDAYVNQIRLNSQLQLALMTLLTSARSIPYNQVGIALQRAACQDPINEALNFGSIQPGVPLSEQQRALINNQARVDAASKIESTGYFLLIQNASAQTRGNRESMPMKLWYTDGGSVHNINLGSINVQ